MSAESTILSIADLDHGNAARRHVPTPHRLQFGPIFTPCIEGGIGWLQTCDSSKLVCANELYMLLNDYSPVTWQQADFQAYLDAVGLYWNNWEG